MLYFVFILSRIFESNILLLFMTFQNSFKLQGLDIAREKYQKMEGNFSKIFIGLGFGFCLPIMLNIMIKCIQRSNVVDGVDVLGTLYFLVSFITLTCMYSAVTLNFTRNLYKYHRMEYGRHIKRIVIIYTATILSSLYGIFYTGSIFYLLICINNGVTDSKNTAFFDYVTVI